MKILKTKKICMICIIKYSLILFTIFLIRTSLTRIIVNLKYATNQQEINKKFTNHISD